MKASGQKKRDETFVRLIQVAQEDPEVHARLKAILSMEPFDRESAIRTFMENSRLAGAPEDFVLALSSLLDRGTADKALDLLNSK